MYKVIIRPCMISVNLEIYDGDALVDMEHITLLNSGKEGKASEILAERIIETAKQVISKREQTKASVLNAIGIVMNRAKEDPDLRKIEKIMMELKTE